MRISNWLRKGSQSKSNLRRYFTSEVKIVDNGIELVRTYPDTNNYQEFIHLEMNDKELEDLMRAIGLTLIARDSINLSKFFHS